MCSHLRVQRQVSRPSQVHVQSPQSSRQVSRPSQVMCSRFRGLSPSVQTSSCTRASDIRNPARDTPIRYDAADARASAALPQSSQVFGGYKAGPWNNRSSPRGGAAALALQRLAQPGGGDPRRAGGDTARMDRTGIGDNRPGRECSGGPTNS